jgi:hypothetical protein
MNDFESVFDDSNGHELFTVVTAVHHEGVDQTFNDWALGLSEPFDLISTRSVW